MKRRRESERADPEIRRAIDELSPAGAGANPRRPLSGADHDEDGDIDNRNDVYKAPRIPTLPFLRLCKLILRVLDKIGPTMAVLRHDVDQNIRRLEVCWEGEPSKFGNIKEMLDAEIEAGYVTSKTSCSRSFLWLLRAVDFSAALLRKLARDPAVDMVAAVEECYDLTLKQWHGWISSAAYKIALKLVPDKRSFMGILMGEEQSQEGVVQEIQTLVPLLGPLMEDGHSTLRSYGLDRLKSI